MSALVPYFVLEQGRKCEEGSSLSCRPRPPGSGTWRMPPINKQKCCERKDVRIPPAYQTSWEADYSRSTDSWHVGVEFDIKGESQSASWTVDDDSQSVFER